MNRIILFLGLCIAGIAAYYFGRNPQKVDYSTQIKPILNKNCISCHGGVKKQGGFSLLFQEEALAKTKSGKPAIIPGHPEESSFIQRLHSQDPEEKMPYQRPALSKEEIELLTTWVKEGATWGEHWAYQPVEAPSIPVGSWWEKALSWVGISSGWAKNELDYFVQAEQKNQGLSPTESAAKPDLLRRLYLDLTGLPPTPSDYAEFEKDNSDEAYEKQVDKLLKSPHFGEKWASMWMDLARYADTKGYEKDEARSIWKYRDYIIGSFNQNKPYDQFIKEQLAGDLVDNPQENDYIATAFHRNTTNNDEGGTEDEEFRTAAILDRVNTTWEVLQGTSFGCVQCHSHPYDPIRHEEYYRYMAFFNNSRDEDIPDDSPTYKHYKPEDEKTIAQLKSFLVNQPVASQKAWGNMIRFVEPKIHPHWADQFDNSALADNKYLAVRNKGSARFKAVPMMGKTKLLIACRNSGPAPTYLTIHQGTKTGPIIARIKLDTTLQEKYAKPKGLFVKGWAYTFVNIPSLPGKQDLVWEFTNAKTKPDQTTATIGFWALLPEVPAALKATEFENLALKAIAAEPELTTPVMLENPADFARTTRVFARGSWINPADPVQPGIPALFKNGPVNNRLDLANWIGGKSNPLTARVAVNRFWEQLFGIGIVETLEDLGSQGLSPVNQPLLDHLAYKFQVDFSYKPKDLLKYIVMSASYQQSAIVDKATREKDPNNRFITRGPRIRLSPEQVRDQALAWSGLLSEKLGGPSVMPEQPDGVWNAPYSGMKWEKSSGEEQWRRSLYTYWRRSSPYPTMVTFDAGTRDICLSRRIRTNTPMQALNTLNDPVFLEASQFFARKYPENGLHFVEKSYADLFGRKIAPKKAETLGTFYTQTLAYYQAHPKETLAFLKICPDNDVPPNPANLVAKTLVANALFNIDESINKP
jgi:mono/diheme cytochrome c family protein